jgi:hypothetical protein
MPIASDRRLTQRRRPSVVRIYVWAGPGRLDAVPGPAHGPRDRPRSAPVDRAAQIRRGQTGRPRPRGGSNVRCTTNHGLLLSGCDTPTVLRHHSAGLGWRLGSAGRRRPAPSLVFGGQRRRLLVRRRREQAWRQPGAADRQLGKAAGRLSRSRRLARSSEPGEKAAARTTVRQDARDVPTESRAGEVSDVPKGNDPHAPRSDRLGNGDCGVSRGHHK